jgi:hypothetical protein
LANHSFEEGAIAFDKWEDQTISITAAKANVKAGDAVEISEITYKVLEVDHFPGTDDVFTAHLTIKTDDDLQTD